MAILLTIDVIVLQKCYKAKNKSPEMPLNQDFQSFIFVISMNLGGIEPSSPEPESDVISITLQIQQYN